MTAARLELSREQVLAHRRRAGSLEARRSSSAASLRRAAWAGLPDSMPRAALVGLHARVRGVEPYALADPTLSQVWGPRFSDYVVAERDAWIFTLGRQPSSGPKLERATSTAERLDTFLDGRRMPFGEAGRGLGMHPNALRYGTTTGRLRISWDGAHQPEVWTVPAPAQTAEEARAELVRRYLHVLGPGTQAGFANWAGVREPGPAFEAIRSELAAVRSPTGDAWILHADEAAFRSRGASVPADTVRLLPSGDTYMLHWGTDRGLIVPDVRERGQAWTTRVWPGVVLLGGEIAGTWRRGEHRVTVHPFRAFTADERASLEAEASSLPLPGLKRSIAVSWES